MIIQALLKAYTYVHTCTNIYKNLIFRCLLAGILFRRGCHTAKASEWLIESWFFKKRFMNSQIRYTVHPNRHIDTHMFKHPYYTFIHTHRIICKEPYIWQYI